MQNGKQGWDTRAWLVGILGGLVGGSVTAWVTYPTLVGPINAALHWKNGDAWVSGIAACLSLLVLPGVLSGITRLWTFLWGLLPLLLFLIGVDTEDWIENGLHSVVKDFWMSLLIIGGCLLVSSGPVSLIRYLRAHSIKRQEAAHTALLAQREAASIPQDGVWPPPPDYRQ